MRKSLGELVSSWYEEDCWLPRVRAVQKKVTEEEWNEMVNLAKKADKPANYFKKMISVARLEDTLKYVRKLLNRSVEVMTYVADKVKGGSIKLANYVADKVAEARYSMFDVTRMVELANKKDYPDRYLIGILKKGYVEYKPKTS